MESIISESVSGMIRQMKKGKPMAVVRNDVATGLEIAKEAAQYDMKVLLDFHYSDFWADPAVQLDSKSMGKRMKMIQKRCVQDVYDFTKESIQKFKDAGANIGMVQVGNEITNGLLGIYSNRDQRRIF